ncbi:hypothetical protein B7486_01185 [cyanobacterium TDX16]|nr:hypothetical protein B7486_01185 [cyanobacterium TDX16]
MNRLHLRAIGSIAFVLVALCAVAAPGDTTRLSPPERAKNPCAACAGNGSRICPLCTGIGWILCSKCQGVGTVTTYFLLSEVTKECDGCEGERRYPCVLCDGERTVPCTACSDQPPQPATRPATSPKSFPSGRAETALKAMFGDGYKIRRTDHFFVLYNTDEAVVKRFIHRVEATYDAVHRFAVKLDVSFSYPDEKLAIIFGNTFEDFEFIHKRLNLRNPSREYAGYYFSGPNVSIFYNGADADWIKARLKKADDIRQQAKNAGTPKERRRLSLWADRVENYARNSAKHRNRMIVQHEVAHQLLYNFQVHRRGVRHPKWLIEGLATLFEPPPTSRGAGFNIINQGRLEDMRGFLEKNNATDFKTMLTEPGQLYGNDDQLTRGYAHAWAMAQFVTRQRPEQFKKYVDLLNARQPGAAVDAEQELSDFESIFGKVDAPFIKRWKQYIMNLPYRPRQ